MNIMSNILLDNINKCFSESFKKDIKKDSKNLKESYRPASILSNISKIYETCLYNELFSYFEDIFSGY